MYHLCFLFVNMKKKTIKENSASNYVRKRRDSFSLNEVDLFRCVEPFRWNSFFLAKTKKIRLAEQRRRISLNRKSMLDDPFDQQRLKRKPFFFR